MPSYVIPAAGQSAASFFSPANFTDPAKPPAFLCRAINPTTGDWNSLFTGIHPVDDHVIRAFRVQENSGLSAIGLGNRFASIRKVDETTARAVEFEIRRLLNPLVRSKDLRIDEITVEADPDGDSSHAFVEYTNLQSLRTRKLELDLNPQKFTARFV